MAQRIAVLILLATWATIQIFLAPQAFGDDPRRLGDAYLEGSPSASSRAMRGMVVALTQGSSDAVRREALRFPGAADVIRKIAAEDRNSVIDALISRLRDPDGAIRAAAAAALGGLAKDAGAGSDSIGAALIVGLGDVDQRVRFAAAVAIGGVEIDGKTKRDAVINALVAHLGDFNYDRETDVSMAAARSLGEFVAHRESERVNVISLLIGHLQDVDLGRFGADALKLGSIAQHGCGRRDPYILIGSRGYPVPQALAQITTDSSVQSNAIVQMLLSHLGDNNTVMRDAVIAALGGLPQDGSNKRDDVIDALMSRLGDKDNFVRCLSTEALGRLAKMNSGKRDMVIEGLINRLGDSDVQVHAAAAEALGGLAEYITRQRSIVIDALTSGLHYFDTTVFPIITDNGREVRANSAEALGFIAKYGTEKRDAVIDALLSALKPLTPPKIDVLDIFSSAPDDYSDERASIAQALGTLATESNNKRDAVIDVLLVMLGDKASAVRIAAARALVGPSKGNSEKRDAVLDALTTSLGDDDSSVRGAAALALGKLATDINYKSDKVIDVLINHLGDHGSGAEVAAALAGMHEPLRLSRITALLELADNQLFSDEPRMEVDFDILTGGDPTLALLRPLLQRSQRENAPHGDPAATLALFVKIWPDAGKNSELRRQIAWHAKTLAQQTCAGAAAVASVPWLPAWATGLASRLGPLPLTSCLSSDLRGSIDTLSQDFAATQLNEADDLKRVLSDDDSRQLWRTVALWLARFAGVHVLFWIALLWLYPRSSRVQSVFFWNPRVRQLAGLHLSLLIPHLPFVVRRLLAPFRPALGPRPDAAAALAVAEATWFGEAEVTEGAAGPRTPITRALPRLRGLTILEGESGLGKTVHLVRLARDPRRVVAFLKAGEEGGDVLKALAARLPAEVMRDEAFLRTLIHARGLDICIDGLNEVSPEARAAVAGFAQATTTANILIATQKIRWNRPAGARLLHLQPLRPDQRAEFLLSREAALPDRAPVRGEAYRQQVETFLKEMEATPPVNDEDRVARQRALSNPMDLTTIATLLANGRTPNLLDLQEAAYRLAAEQYQAENNGAEFPLHAFSEHVFQQRCAGTGDERELMLLREPRFAAACDVLADQRLLLREVERMEAGREVVAWRFRHDKVLDFFLYTAMRHDAERIDTYRKDPRFRGVVLLLALRAPVERAVQLRDQIQDDAYATRDQSLSEEVWRIVGQRLDAARPPEAAAPPAGATGLLPVG